MASQNILPAFNLSNPDDTMEFTSDAGRNDDFDIDLMEGDDEIDYMHDDAPNTANDDLMVDDEAVDEINYEEEPMQTDGNVPTDTPHDLVDLDLIDDFQPTEDTTSYPNENTTQPPSHDYEEAPEEDLIDYDTDVEELQVDLTQDVGVANTDKSASLPDSVEQEITAVDLPLDYAQEDAGFGVAALPEVVAAEQQVLEPEVDVSQEEQQSVHSPLVLAEVHAELPNETSSGSDHGSPQATSEKVPDVSNLEAEQALATTEDDAPVDSGEALHTDTVNFSSVEAQELHPVTVIYNEVSMSLFPPHAGDEAETFLLQDTSVAYGTLVELFRACRAVLAQDIDEKSELEIYAEHLNLAITEVCIPHLLRPI